MSVLLGGKSLRHENTLLTCTESLSQPVGTPSGWTREEILSKVSHPTSVSDLMNALLEECLKKKRSGNASQKI